MFSWRRRTVLGVKVNVGDWVFAFVICVSTYVLSLSLPPLSYFFYLYIYTLEETDRHAQTATGKTYTQTDRHTNISTKRQKKRESGIEKAKKNTTSPVNFSFPGPRRFITGEEYLDSHLLPLPHAAPHLPIPPLSTPRHHQSTVSILHHCNVTHTNTHNTWSSCQTITSLIIPNNPPSPFKPFSLLPTTLILPAFLPLTNHTVFHHHHHHPSFPC